MTEATPSRGKHTIAANLVWFAGIFVLGYMAMSSLAPLLFTRGGPLLGQILFVSFACAVAAFVAGTRFADSRTDLSQRRNVLIVSYVALAATLCFAVPALMLGGLLLSGVAMSPEASHSLLGRVFLVLITIVATVPLNGAIVWFILSSLVRSRENS